MEWTWADLPHSTTRTYIFIPESLAKLPMRMTVDTIRDLFPLVVERWDPREISPSTISHELAERFWTSALPAAKAKMSLNRMDGLLDAFVYSFRNSTHCFPDDPSQRMPPLKQCINLLTSIWIYQELRARSPEEDKKWPRSPPIWIALVSRLEKVKNLIELWILRVTVADGA